MLLVYEQAYLPYLKNSMMKSTIVRRNVWGINTSFTFSVRAVMLTSLFRQKRFKCEVTSTSTEKLSSPCHDQWLDTVSTNLGTSLGFDHNNEKNVRFPTLATFILWKIILLEGDVT